MQLQKSQALFAVSSYTMPFVRVDPVDIDLSDDGKLVLFNTLPKENQDSLKSYQLSTIQGAVFANFDSVSYAYFVNGSHLALVCKRVVRQEYVASQEPDRAFNKRGKRAARLIFEFRNEAFLYDCIKDVKIPIPLEKWQQIYDLPSIVRFINDGEESYNLQALANGNLLVPYRSMDSIA